MSDELERRRADLEVLKRYNNGSFVSSEIRNLEVKIDALEAEAADPWREAKKSIDHWRNCGMWPDITGLYDHLTAENARLAKKSEVYDRLYDELQATKSRVAELEGVATDVTALLETTEEASDPSTDTYVAVTVANVCLSEKRVNELEDVKDVADMQPPFEGPIVGIEPGPLEPSRVLLTAIGILVDKREFRCSAAISDAMFRLGISADKPYKLKGAGE